MALVQAFPLKRPRGRFLPMDLPDDEDELGGYPARGPARALVAESLLGRRLPRIEGEGWSKPIALSPNVVLEAREGTRAAWVQFAPGAWIVVEVPDSGMDATISGVDEVGFVDLIMKAAMGTANAVQQGVKAGKAGGNAGEVFKNVGKGFLDGFAPGLLPGPKAPRQRPPAAAAPAAPAGPPPGWCACPPPAAPAIGCEGCSRCRRGL